MNYILLDMCKSHDVSKAKHWETDLAKESGRSSFLKTSSEICCLNGNAQLKTAVAAPTHTHTYTLPGLDTITIHLNTYGMGVLW